MVNTVGAVETQWKTTEMRKVSIQIEDNRKKKQMSNVYYWKIEEYHKRGGAGGRTGGPAAMGRWRQASRVRDRRVIDDFRLAQPGLCLVRSTALFSISFETVYMLLWAGHHQLGRRQNHVDHATLGTMSDIRIVIPQPSR